jgi:phosphoglycolate phosphatase
LHICLFDIDGTLIASGGAGKAALEAALAAEFGIARIHDTFSLSGRTDRAILTELIGLFDLDPSPDTARRLIEAYLRHLPTHLSTLEGRVLPGIRPLLDHLRGRDDVAVGLLTGNTRAGARMKLSHFALWDYFSFGGYGDDHLDRDDVAREALCRAHECLDGRVSNDRVWVIGDTPLDIRCARAIGARVVAVATGWHAAEELAGHAPDLLLPDLADALPFLNHLC